MLRTALAACAMVVFAAVADAKAFDFCCARCAAGVDLLYYAKLNAFYNPKLVEKRIYEC